MLTKQQKQKLVKELADKFKRHKAVVFTDYTGLTVSDLQSLRRQMKSQNMDYQVAKKTLLNLAVKEAGISGVDVPSMIGQIAVGFSYEDEVAPAKILSGFAGKNSKLKIIAGILNGGFIESAKVATLARLPNLDGLRAQLTRVLSAPMRNFASVLQGNLRGLVAVLNQIKNK